MSYLDEVKAIIDTEIQSSDDPERIKKLTEARTKVDSAEADGLALLEKHNKLKKDYIELVKSAPVTQDNPNPAAPKKLSNKEILEKAGLKEQIKFYKEN